MTNPTIGDILRVAIAEQLSVSVRWKGGDDQAFYGPMKIDRDKAAKICLEAVAVKITFFLPDEPKSNIKLSDLQKAVLKAWQKYPNEICVKLSDGYFLTGGHGINIPKNTYSALRKRELVGTDSRLTQLGKTIKL